MSKTETPMIRRYWEMVGGTLIEEFPVVKGTRYQGARRIDAIIIKNGERRIAKSNEVSLKGKDIICVQAKSHRLGMYLMGQTFFSEQLLRRFEPSSVSCVALCAKDDAVLRPLIEQYPQMKVVVID